MVGALNKLPVAASGILFLGDPATFGNVFGILFGFIAGLLYSYSKTDQAQKNLAKASNTTLTHTSLGNQYTKVGDSEGTASALDGDVVELKAPENVTSKSMALPLYKSNPDGKIAD